MPGTFVDELFDVTIRDGNAVFDYPGGKQRVIPLRVLRIMHERVAEAVARHDARCAKVVPLKGD
jgi:hypothetical protein